MKFAYLIEPPFNYVDARGHVTGCDVELARYICKDLNVKFEPVETEFAQLLLGISAGLWHMTTGLFATDERRETASFSRPIWALSDGLLVREGNPLDLGGYRSVAGHGDARIAVVRDQVQHRSAIHLGVAEHQVAVFETYTEAAKAVLQGDVDAYASVARAHSGFLNQNPDWPVELVRVPPSEKPPAFGCFAFALQDDELRRDVDAVLEAFLGTSAHRDMIAPFGFSDAEVELICPPLQSQSDAALAPHKAEATKSEPQHPD
ncbi:transporter substrate-binding domain-containing protein [Litoreibacter roseus]|uniref:Ectoine/hydroxyectoine ABC transporter substrate-binding protein EhuB n=1 Tax=Litoreibacter roseus TaxID=2601869 RepID=A0A6N6JIH3_9RHOB|nr:transporter substrate-binding domain-containing protein [Litoreibacter roseus]GFE66066.1 ectoine/hydroxyectoine ABC transporter substrate-binding protein EhuB [Litoreibacter roseus]